MVAVEQQAHGHTADIDRPLAFEHMGDDTATLLRRLGIECADILGYSDGGNVAISMAIRHPPLGRKLVLAGVNFDNEGLVPEFVEFMNNATAEDIGDELRCLCAGCAASWRLAKTRRKSREVERRVQRLASRGCSIDQRPDDARDCCMRLPSREIGMTEGTFMLRHKTAVIYGAGGAIGGAVARAFARHGVSVFLAGRTLAKVDAVAKDFSAAGLSAEAAQVDALNDEAETSC